MRFKSDKLPDLFSPTNLLHDLIDFQIKVVVCTECGKPCRTDAEKDMHTRFTGHASFVDKVIFIIQA